MPSMSPPRDSAISFADVLDLLNFDPASEFVSIGYYVDKDDLFRTAVRTPPDAPAYVAGLPADANTFYGINPTEGPARENAGRGTEDKVTRLATLPVDLDIEPDKCPTRDIADAIIAELSILLNSRPSATTDSGHGVHAVWAISDGEIVNGDIGPKRALLKRWGRLVEHVAAKKRKGAPDGVKVDGVYDLPRMLRVAGTTNNKPSTNGQAPPPVVGHADTGRPLSMAEVCDRLDEWGIVERPEDSQAVSTTVVSEPADWVGAQRTCTYVARMLAAWPTDSPRNGARNPLVYGLHIRLFCAFRAGCLTQEDYERGLKILSDLLAELVTTTGTPRKVRKYEIADMMKHGIAKVAAKTDEQVAAELGDHHGTPQSASSSSQPPPASNGSTPPPDGSTPPVVTTWEPIDLGPYLAGTIVTPTPTLGMVRSDGVRFIYPGREHAVLGETESGKTWFALGCVAAELMAGKRVLYLHYEEADPGSTIERLQLLGVNKVLIAALLTFVAPDKPPRSEWVDALCQTPPALVVHDGVNEAMAMMGAEMNTDGASEFRRRLVTPFLKLGAASIACDHLPMNPAPGRVNAYGTVHKGNVLNGARIQLENKEPFGRGMRGVSHVFVTKDRPGYLRTKGRADKVPGKTYMGTLVVDDEPVFTPFTMMLYAPKDGESSAGMSLATSIHKLIWEQPDHKVPSRSEVEALLRQSDDGVSHQKVRDALADLKVDGKIVPYSGPKNATGYEAVKCP